MPGAAGPPPCDPRDSRSRDVKYGNGAGHASSSPENGFLTATGSTNFGPSYTMAFIAFVLAMGCSSVIYRYGGASEETGGAGVGGKPLFAPAAASTWLERLMATYERRIWIGFRRISELTGQAKSRLPCKDVHHRGECLGLGCVYDTARGCLDAKHPGQRLDARKVREGEAGSSARPFTGRRSGQAHGQPHGPSGTGIGDGICERAEMQKRRDCKANPTCVYDTALGCYTNKSG